MKAAYKQLIIARQYKGITQSDLTKAIPGLSQSTLSKFEKGVGSISDEILNKIAVYLGFPISFFDKDISNRIQNANYRKRSNVGAKAIAKIESVFHLIGDIIDSMSDDIEFPKFNLAFCDLNDGITPVKVAQYVRSCMRVKFDTPMNNLIKHIEELGVFVIEIDSELESFDGVSFISLKGFPIIVINKNKPNDRKRYTIAHELGHIIMHLSPEFDYLISENRNKEDEANVFASELLMPEAGIRNSLVGMKLTYLAELKRIWMTSMASIIRRAKDLKCIDQNKYQYFNIELSRLGYKKKEPIEVQCDSPQIIEKAYDLYRNELDYSIQDMSYAFAVPIDFLNNLFNLDNKKIRLKLDFVLN